MHILIVEPYDTGSHRVWMQGYQAASTHQVSIMSLPGHFWKWRMQGGAVPLARQYLALEHKPDLIIATDMLDLTSFLALTRPDMAHTPVVMYCHENQITYPMGPRQRKEIHFQLGLINYLSALAADRVLFNNQFHMDAFFDELPNVLKHYPDYNELDLIPNVQAKSDVLSLGLDLRRFDAYKPAAKQDDTPLIVWNHRWEYDKRPKPFLNAIVRLRDEGYDFRVAITGENFRQEPTEFEKARVRLGDCLVQYGYIESFADYARLLWDADLQVSTAAHDFFGISTVEALYCECATLLPKRLNYPALIPDSLYERYLYLEGRIYHRLKAWLEAPASADADLREHVAQFDWIVQAPRYDALFADIAAQKRGSS